MYSSASVASGGIEAGQSWLDWIHTQIKESIMTIVILTPLSKTRPWLMWEAGAVSGIGLVQNTSSPVVPLLFGLKGDEVPSPLRERQTKSGAIEYDIRDLLESMRLLGNMNYKSDSHVTTLIESYIQAVTKIRIPGMYDVFISCPMASIDTSSEYKKLNQTIDSLFNAISTRGYTVYSAMKIIGNQQFDQEAIAAERDLNALASSRSFLMIYPRHVVSSCLLEAGYALIAGIPSTYFVHNDDDLPYMLRGAVESFRNARRVRFSKETEIVDFFNRYPERIIA
jgi:hypothetical protein